jgi:dCMP deaminase
MTNFTRPDWDTYFMLQAHVAKLRSNCLTRQIGAVIVKDKREIATGYNGTPAGIKNCFEGGCERCLERKEGKVASGTNLDRCVCNHAESNAILQCSILGNVSTVGATIYTTLAPCLDCSKMIVTAGIKKVVCYLDGYPETAGKLFEDAGVEVIKIQPDLHSWYGRASF